MTENTTKTSEQGKMTDRVTKCFNDLITDCRTVAEKTLGNLEPSEELTPVILSGLKSLKQYESIIKISEADVHLDDIEDFYTQFSNIMDLRPIDEASYQSPAVPIDVKVNPVEDMLIKSGGNEGSNKICIDLGLFLNLAARVDGSKLTEKSMSLLILYNFYKLVFLAVDGSDMRSKVGDKCRSIQSSLGLNKKATDSSVAQNAPQFSLASMMQALGGGGNIFETIAPLMNTMKPMLKQIAQQSDPTITAEKLAEIDNIDMSTFLGGITTAMQGGNIDMSAMMESMMGAAAAPPSSQ